MCGLTGIYNLDSRPVDPFVLQKMTDKISHRGPDDQAFSLFSCENGTSYFMERVTEKKDVRVEGGLGFNRLSILDVSSHGRQPMSTQDGRIIIAYNGETYNAFFFRSMLEQRGVRFRGSSDTEIILYLYREFGIDTLLSMMNGMFGFCIVDLDKKKLYLARDHAGIKPLFWYRKGGTILFGSEMKCFYPHPDFMPVFAEENYHEFFLQGYNSYDRTLLQNVQKVPPGHYLEVSESGTKLVEYWRPSLATTHPLKLTEAIEQVEEKLKSAVYSQLLSDVPLGCQLSGGIDSSLVATFAAPAMGEGFKAFSVLPQNKRYSEEEYIDTVIDKLKPVPVKIRVGAEEWSRRVADAAFHQEVPVSFPHAVSVMRMAEEASRTVKVLLSGEGSDELMGGYPTFHRYAFRKRHERCMPLYCSVPGRGRKYKNYFLPHLSDDEFYIFIHSDMRLLGPGIWSKLDMGKMYSQQKQLLADTDEGDPVKRARLFNMRGRMTHLLDVQDRMMMAASVEDRVPFLDKEFIEFIFSLPSSLFVRAGLGIWSYKQPNKRTKIVLKRVASKYYNKKFVYRSKMGFSQPLSDYIDSDHMRDFAEDVLLPGIRSRGVFDMTAIAECKKEKGHRQRAGNLWKLYGFEIWARQYLDSNI